MNRMIANSSISAGLRRGRKKGQEGADFSWLGPQRIGSDSWFHRSKTLGLLAMSVLNACVKINITTKDLPGLSAF